MSTFDASSFDVGIFDAARIIYTAKVQTKLNMVTSKDAQQIYDAHIYLPRLGIPNSIADVQQWLNKVASLLQTIQSSTGTQIAVQYNEIYTQLCTSCKKIVDAPHVINQQSCVIDQDRVVMLRLYRFATAT